jgi:tetratricopeptide (TPR) repeat protein
VLNASIGQDVPFEDLLVEHSLVNPTELYKLLQQNLARKLLDAFSWTAGTFRISHDPPPVDSPLRVKPSQLIVTGISRFASKRDVDDAVKEFLGKKLAINPEPLFPLAEIRLNAAQVELTRALSTSKTLAELLASKGGATEELNRLIYPLLLLRIAVPEEELPAPKAQAPSSAAAPQMPAPRMQMEVTGATEELTVPFLKQIVPAQGAQDQVAATSRDDLMRVYLSFRRRDPFDLFELQESATLGAINAAWESFARKFAPWQFQVDSSEQLQEKAQEIFFAGSRAYAELADGDRRNALIGKRRAAREKPKPAAPSETAVDSATKSGPVLLDPEAQHRLGRQLSEAGRHREALSHFQFAAECDAQNGVYQSEVIYTRFQLMATTATQALSALKEVMRIDPKCGLAWYYAGKIHETLGHKMEAEAYIDRGKNMINLAKRGRR